MEPGPFGNGRGGRGLGPCGQGGTVNPQGQPVTPLPNPPGAYPAGTYAGQGMGRGMGRGFGGGMGRGMGRGGGRRGNNW